MKHLSEEDLILIYYNEPGLTAGAGAHLAACNTCRAAADALAATLDICDKWEELEPAPDFGRTTWARLAPQLRDSPRHWLAPFFQTRVWITAAAAAMLLIAAFIAGRGTGGRSHPEQAITAGLSQQARARILAISLADHLDRAGRLLTEVSNLGEADSAALTAEQGRAQDLVNEGRLMRQWLAGQEGAAILPLLDDVERFMLELANAPDRAAVEEIRELKQHMESQSLLFKVRIIESNLRTSGRTS
jgi:hypothetical protein